MLSWLSCNLRTQDDGCISRWRSNHAASVHVVPSGAGSLCSLAGWSLNIRSTAWAPTVQMGVTADGQDNWAIQIAGSIDVKLVLVFFFWLILICQFLQIGRTYHLIQVRVSFIVLSKQNPAQVGHCDSGHRFPVQWPVTGPWKDLLKTDLNDLDIGFFSH